MERNEKNEKIAWGIIGVLALFLGFRLTVAILSSESSTTPEVVEASPSDVGTLEQPTSQPTPDNSISVEALTRKIYAIDEKGQKVIKGVLPHLERYSETGSDQSREKIEEAMASCRSIASELHEVSSANIGEVSLLDTIPGEAKPKSARRKYAEAALQYAQAYEFSAESFDKFLGFMEGPPDMKRLKAATKALKAANGMREQAQVEMALAD